MAVVAVDVPVRRVRQERLRFSADQYVAMFERGILPPEPHTELIDGEIVVVPMPGPLHCSVQSTLIRLFAPALAEQFDVRVDGSVRMASDAVVQPDFALLRPIPGAYSRRLPDAGDVLLAVEVAYSSLAHDRRRKLPLYARHGVPEVWLVSLPERRLEVHRDPAGRRYRDVALLADGDQVAPLCAPEVVVDVGEVLRERFREGAG